ncbi:oligosaccharyl transferase subunit OST3/OST6 family [Rickenella mellea]|uniref:Oligosaccharyl transferase subunit OST3/OST6 family n=1 Tax=Rickenella mellea TaxID=50990 RepID=A0A4Y7QKZ1_9AGAM|nr:oligosaccharyl transferase subunit OST3/OST6 family [Rickenella mellea]
MLISFLTLLLLPLVHSAPSPHEQLISLAAANNGVIKLDSRSWDLLTTSKRNWSATVQYTALDKNMKCTPCREFDPTFNTVAKTWMSVSKENRDQHFFATLDYKDGPDVFKKLSIVSAPVVSLYPAAQGPHRPASGKTDPFSYDFNNYGYDPQELAFQVNLITPVPVPYRAPFNWGLLGTGVTSVLLLALAGRYSLPVIMSRWAWAAVSIGISLVMTSGFMFVRIRGMPYRSAEGTMMAGFQNQLGAEIWTVAFTYGTLSFCWLALVLLVPRQTSEKRQRIGIYLFSLILIFLYSLLLQYFRLKNQGYPFSLFL